MSWGCGRVGVAFGVWGLGFRFGVRGVGVGVGVRGCGVVVFGCGLFGHWIVLQMRWRLQRQDVKCGKGAGNDEQPVVHAPKRVIRSTFAVSPRIKALHMNPS